ncbi:hypothetical protein EGW08_004840 [Elysia chlorotica]|uniref:ShKT domain-containing protein n=1 Tax=Elysia chlorotica TaxID=188477 RepID=A0A3S1ABA9_ELYCH|nr:hypothetical protein EGW08_004840 [Elysia chlorotica]
MCCLAHPDWCDRSDVRSYCPWTCGLCADPQVDITDSQCFDQNEAFCRGEELTGREREGEKEECPVEHLLPATRHDDLLPEDLQRLFSFLRRRERGLVPRTDIQLFCTKSCNKCSGSPGSAMTAGQSSSCVDQDETWCQDAWDRCDRQDVQDYCPRTCQKCTGADAVSVCADTDVAFCTQNAWDRCDRQDVQDYCPRTCQKCTGADAVSVCADTDVGFCTQSKHSNSPHNKANATTSTKNNNKTNNKTTTTTTTKNNNNTNNKTNDKNNNKTTTIIDNIIFSEILFALFIFTYLKSIYWYPLYRRKSPMFLILIMKLAQARAHSPDGLFISVLYVWYLLGREMYCGINDNFRRNCRKTCGVCSTGKVGDIDGSPSTTILPATTNNVTDENTTAIQSEATEKSTTALTPATPTTASATTTPTITTSTTPATTTSAITTSSSTTSATTTSTLAADTTASTPTTSTIAASTSLSTDSKATKTFEAATTLKATETSLSTSPSSSVTNGGGGADTRISKTGTRLCYQCGSESAPCTGLELLIGQPELCPPDLNYCATYVTQSDGVRGIVKKCITLDTCFKKWFQESSDLPQCMNFESRDLSANFDCKFCCVGDNCNNGIRPAVASLYTPASDV